MKKKSVALLMALVLVVGGVIGGTLAWLQDTSNKVQNTFTVGNIQIELDETKVENGVATSEKTPTGNSYKLVPGNTYVKDPKVTVKEGSEPCYIYVEIIEEGNTFGQQDKYIQYAINTADWTKIDGTNVYYYKDVVNALAADVVMESTVLATVNGKQITINPGITEADMEAAEDAKIDFIAYAIQSENTGANAVEAWAKFNK